jgi:putative CocE/NonD family hydrolase
MTPVQGTPEEIRRTLIQVTWDQKIPMRDGTRLSGIVFRDPKQAKPLPVILAMTPYIAEHAAKQGLYFAQNGYVFVSVDHRGRGNSEGTFLPGQSEGRDGFDTVEWIARQPWCNGQVATWGGSWLGFNQWSLAKEFPPHLKTMVPTAAVHPGVDFPVGNGFFNYYMLQWLGYVQGKALNQKLFEAGGFWGNAEWEQVQSGRPFVDLESITGMTGTVFRTWLAHPTEDAFWQALSPRPEHYAKFEMPILTITGHYDDDQLGALTYYDRHMAFGKTEATQNHYLVIGPWDHFGTRRPKADLAGLSFGKDAVLDMEALHKAWYDHVLKGGPRPEFLKDRVACFVMGSNRWIYARDLKQLEQSPLMLQLDLAGAEVGQIHRTGVLVAKAGTAKAQVILLSDPSYLPDRAESEFEDPNYLTSQRSIYKKVGSQVMLHSDPFDQEMVLSGRPRLRLELACDQPDADLSADLQEVLANGSAVSLTSTSVRLRHRKLGSTPEWMVPGRPELVEFPAFGFFARAVAPGSRLRLVVSCGPWMGVQRNTNTGGDLVSEPLSKGRVARITLMTGPGTGSALELPRPEASLLKPPDKTGPIPGKER